MQATKEFLTDFPAFFGAAVAEIREEAVAEKREEIHEEGVEQERKRLILYWHTSIGLTATQIANTMVLSVEYVQSIIDKNASD